MSGHKIAKRNCKTCSDLLVQVKNEGKNKGETTLNFRRRDFCGKGCEDGTKRLQGKKLKS